MEDIVLSATGVYVPKEYITNEELVHSFNQFVDRHNLEKNKTGEPFEPLKYSSSDFIVKAAGIEKRYVLEKSGILDIDCMQPRLPYRNNEEPSIQCEMAVHAAESALKEACLRPQDIDAVIVACSNMQRAYPAIAVEVQHALGIDGFGFDINAACASATFGIQMAADTIARQSADTVLLVNPEVMTGQLNFRDRDSHFIFGDAATASIIQRRDKCKSKHPFKILGTLLKSQFSNNIRNNFGFLWGMDDSCSNDNLCSQDRTFSQQGRKVFKEVVPMVADLVLKHLENLNLTPNQLKRLWLHQANANMNRLIATKILDREPEFLEAPTILQEYGNTSSPGAIIAFNFYHQDLKSGDLGIICAFGAGYSVGNIVLQKL